MNSAEEALPPVIFLTSFLVALSGAATPGPVLTVVIGEAARRGFWAGPLIVAGHAILELVTVALVASGIRLLDPQGPLVAAISILGAVALFWIAWGLLRTARRSRMANLVPQRTARTPAQGLSQGWHRGGLVGMGIVVSLANPYWTIWWLTIGATYVVWSLRATAVGLLCFYAGHVLGDLAWYAAVAGLVARGRRFLSLRLYQGLLQACAVFLVALGLLFAWNGATRLA
ncbi:MAG: LysE family transporter [Chloroflexi bacterium]|nr:LysE family transporter [Chloroflexota bacterium]